MSKGCLQLVHLGNGPRTTVKVVGPQTKTMPNEISLVGNELHQLADQRFLLVAPCFCHNYTPPIAAASFPSKEADWLGCIPVGRFSRWVHESFEGYTHVKARYQTLFPLPSEPCPWCHCYVLDHHQAIQLLWDIILDCTGVNCTQICIQITVIFSAETLVFCKICHIFIECVFFISFYSVFIYSRHFSQVKTLNFC